MLITRSRLLVEEPEVADVAPTEGRGTIWDTASGRRLSSRATHPGDSLDRLL